MEGREVEGWGRMEILNMAEENGEDGAEADGGYSEREVKRNTGSA